MDRVRSIWTYESELADRLYDIAAEQLDLPPSSTVRSQKRLQDWVDSTEGSPFEVMTFVGLLPRCERGRRVLFMCSGTDPWSVQYEPGESCVIGFDSRVLVHRVLERFSASELESIWFALEGYGMVTAFEYCERSKRGARKAIEAAP